MRVTSALASMSYAVSLVALWGCGDEKSAPFAGLPTGTEDAGNNVPDPLGVGDGGGPVEFTSDWARPEDPDRICAGWEFSCGIDVQGGIQCWGGTAAADPKNLPDGEFERIACGDSHACAIDLQGNVKCWGNGMDPMMSAGAHLGQAAPPTGAFKEITCGGAHSCGIHTDGTVACWGAGNPKSDNGTAPHLSQAVAPRGSFTKLSAGEAYTCGIKALDQSIVCWGGGGECFPPQGYNCGQLEPPKAKYVAVSAGLAHACGLTVDGELICWGMGGSDDDCDPPASDAVRYACGQSMAQDGTFVRLDVGHHHTCVIGGDGVMKCFGWNPDKANDFLVSQRFAQVSGGHQHTCAVTADGAVDCRGTNAAGEIDVPNTFPGD